MVISLHIVAGSHTCPASKGFRTKTAVPMMGLYTTKSKSVFRNTLSPGTSFGNKYGYHNADVIPHSTPGIIMNLVVWVQTGIGVVQGKGHESGHGPRGARNFRVGSSKQATSTCQSPRMRLEDISQMVWIPGVCMGRKCAGKGRGTSK